MKDTPPAGQRSMVLLPTLHTNQVYVTAGAREHWFNASYSVHGDAALSQKFEERSGTLRSRQLNEMNSIKC